MCFNSHARALDNLGFEIYLGQMFRLVRAKNFAFLKIKSYFKFKKKGKKMKKRNVFACIIAEIRFSRANYTNAL